MLISKLNRLFHKHGRIAFGLLTLFIIVPFVLYFSVAPQEVMNMLTFGSKKSNISVNGKRVPQKDFDQAMRSLMISLSTQGWPIDFNSSTTYQQLTPGAIERLILMNEIKRLNISPDDAQIADYLKTLPLLQDANGFSFERYKMVIYALGRYGITQAQFESAIRDDAAIGLFKKIVAGGVIVTENGALDFYNNLNQAYSVKVAEFLSKNYLSKVQISDKDIEDYFKANASLYITPSKSKAFIVRFGMESYKDEALRKITEDQINKSYELEKANFESMSENEAKDKIKEQLIEQFCSDMAKLKAQEFAVNAYKAIEQAGKVASNAQTLFEELATKNNLEVVKTSSWISSDGELIENIGKEPSLVRQISSLYQDQPVSNAVEGRKAYFVALLTERIDAKPATLDEVRKQVTEDYKKIESLKLAQEDASKFRESMMKEDSSKISAESKFAKSFTFSQNDFAGIMSDPNARDIIELSTNTPQGKLSNVVNNPDGAIIVFVEKISLPPKEDFDKNKEAIEGQYKSALGEISWMNYNIMLRNKANVLVYDSIQR